MNLIVIVGGSAGLGLVLAEQSAVEGAARVVLVARSAERLAAACAMLGQKHPRTEFLSCAADISSESGASDLGLYLEQLSQPIDLLVNAVGASDRGNVLGLKAQRIEELMRVNVIAPLLVTQALHRLMSPRSTIVNIGSLSSLFAPSYLGGYSIAKHGLRALTQQLRLELAERGIHVLLVCPGPIAREDTGHRYAHLESAADIPKAALQGGGGAKIRVLDPQVLARDILIAAKARKLEIIRPRRARLLLILSAVWPRLGESILKRKTV